jgi:hypothetical protein
MTRVAHAFLAVAFAIAPLGARAADLVVWWDKGFYAQEDEALHEPIAAFEQASGKQVELGSIPRRSCPTSSWRRSKPAGRPALEDRLVDLSDQRQLATFRTCSIRLSSTGPCCSMPRPGSASSTACRWAKL